MKEGLISFAIRSPASFLLALLISALFLVPAAHGETIKIGGTGMDLGTMRQMAEAFMKANPADKVTVVKSLGSSGGVRALLAGAIDLSLTARPLKKKEIAKGAVGYEYAKTPLVIATSKENTPAGFSLEQLRQIYSGEITRWPDGSVLRLIMRNHQYGAAIVRLKRISPEMRRAIEKSYSRKGLKYARTDQQNADALESNQGSFGTIPLSTLLGEKRKLKPMALGGILPEAKNIADKSYRYYFQLFIIHGPRKPSAQAGRFLDFVFSPRGQEILKRTGHLPVQRKG